MEGKYNRYRRGENGGWEELMGMSWEKVSDYNIGELEKAFQEWTTQNTPN